MLVLTRKLGERIHIGDDVVVVVLDVSGTHVRLGIEAPSFVPIRREELCGEAPRRPSASSRRATRASS